MSRIHCLCCWELKNGFQVSSSSTRMICHFQFFVSRFYWKKVLQIKFDKQLHLRIQCNKNGEKNKKEISLLRPILDWIRAQKVTNIIHTYSTYKHTWIQTSIYSMSTNYLHLLKYYSSICSFQCSTCEILWITSMWCFLLLEIMELFFSRRQSMKALDLNPDERNSSCTEVNITCDYCSFSRSCFWFLISKILQFQWLFKALIEFVITLSVSILTLFITSSKI